MRRNLLLLLLLLLLLWVPTPLGSPMDESADADGSVAKDNDG